MHLMYFDICKVFFVNFYDDKQLGFVALITLGNPYAHWHVSRDISLDLFQMQAVLVCCHERNWCLAQDVFDRLWKNASSDPMKVFWIRLDVLNHDLASKVKARFTIIAPNLCILPSLVLPSQTRLLFSLGHNRPSPRTMTCAALQPHITLVCRLDGQTSVIHVNTTNLLTLEGLKVEWAFLADTAYNIPTNIPVNCSGDLKFENDRHISIYESMFDCTEQSDIMTAIASQTYAVCAWY